MEEDYSRSRSSYGGGGNNMQVVNYYGRPTRPPPTTSSYELRSYSASYAQTQMANHNYNYNNRELKKGKSISGSSSSWGILADPELQRKKRVASYKMYSVEGKMKGSFRKSFRWLKDKYTQCDRIRLKEPNNHEWRLEFSLAMAREEMNILQLFLLRFANKAHQGKPMMPFLPREEISKHKKNFRMVHETNSLAEEKQLLKEIDERP
ncbi:hypothetical protein ACFX2I_016476 [Malus domestica]